MREGTEFFFGIASPWGEDFGVSSLGGRRLSLGILLLPGFGCSGGHMSMELDPSPSGLGSPPLGFDFPSLDPVSLSQVLNEKESGSMSITMLPAVSSPFNLLSSSSGL